MSSGLSTKHGRAAARYPLVVLSVLQTHQAQLRLCIFTSCAFCLEQTSSLKAPFQEVSRHPAPSSLPFRTATPSSGSPQPLLPPCSGPKSQRTGVLTGPTTTHMRSTAARALPDENRPLLMPVPHSYRLTDTHRNMHPPHRPAPSTCWRFSPRRSPVSQAPPHWNPNRCFQAKRHPAVHTPELHRQPRLHLHTCALT